MIGYGHGLFGVLLRVQELYHIRYTDILFNCINVCFNIERYMHKHGMNALDYNPVQDGSLSNTSTHAQRSTPTNIPVLSSSELELANQPHVRLDDGVIVLEVLTGRLMWMCIDGTDYLCICMHACMSLVQIGFALKYIRTVLYHNLY